MADFDPYANQQQINQPEQVAPKQNSRVPDAPAEPKKKIKNVGAAIVFITICCFPVAFSILGGLFIGGEYASIINYIVMFIGIAVQFYETKNFAGRYLAGLRWHTYTVEGKTYYYFEQRNQEEVSKCDKSVFWGCLWGMVVLYALETIVYLFSILTANIKLLAYTPIAVIGEISSVLNLMGYIKCSSDYKKKLKSMGTEIGKQVVKQQLREL
uniref:Golgi apparatus membrane protein TVP23 homolog n=1 Tax=Trepomonas sp. PC1 TaxID=1076344 RepID=A0A146KIU8_9EUKA|eukprot:JAP95515.1 Transmembrane domain-containing protein [Trepomonas sp. PC1]